MKSTYYPSHSQNRMKHEGDVASARKYFMTGKNRILYHLVKQRYSWMNKYIKEADETVVELGCGAGFSRQFIRSDKLILTDVVSNEWVDRYLDAMNIDYPDGSIDVVICSNMIHHISNPAVFFDMVSRKLKPGGRIIIQDIYTCFLMKAVLRLMRHEGWSDTVDVFDRKAVCNEPSDPWSANCSIPKLLFFSKLGGGKSFEQEFPEYTMLKRTRNECFLFLLSGGVIAKTFHLPVGDIGVEMLKRIDRLVVRCFPSIFACACSVVLQKKKHS